ncbi:MAG TPA: tetratricopeptide repeat protein [Kiloniellaceae bacterium]|nr:tetratricopeptide repeat protein [Kiloniellaceae bacterium]
MRATRAVRPLPFLGALLLLGLLSGCAGDRPPASGLESLRSSAHAAETAPASDDEVLSQYESVMRVAERTDNERDRAIAVGLYQRAHEIDPSQAEPLLHLVTFYEETGQPAQVTEAYRRLVEIDPKNPEYQLRYGLQLLHADQPYRARDHFLTAAALQPDVRSLNATGVTYDMTGDRKAAQVYYRRALKLEADYLPARGNLGLSLALSGNYPAAIALLEETAAMPDAGPAHRRMLATAYGLAGDMAAAKRVAGEDFDGQSLAENLEFYGAAD